MNSWEGRSVGDSTDVGAAEIERRHREGLHRREAMVRIEFIKLFPHLAPLMYSLPIEGPEPSTVEGWLQLMNSELDGAYLVLLSKRRGQA